MLTVYKYAVAPSLETIDLDIPGGGPIISAGIDPGGNVCVWAMVDTDEPEEKVRILCVGTGWPLDAIMNEEANGLNFIGTVKEGIYMWHLFQEV